MWVFISTIHQKFSVSKRVKHACFYILLSLSLSLDAFSCALKDDFNRYVNLPQPATRIISLSPDLTEILFAIGSGKQLVGVLQPSDYPPEAAQLEQVGSFNGLNIEKILSLKPDLIVTWDRYFLRALSPLKKKGIAIYVAAPQALSDIPRTMRHLGCLSNHPQEAEYVAHLYEQRLKRLKQRYQHKKAVPTVFFMIGSQALMTILQHSWIDEAISLCGARSVLTAKRGVFPVISFEALLLENPDVVMNSSIELEWKQRFQAWPQLTAVRDGLLFNIMPDWIERAGPRLVEGVTQMCEFIDVARAHLSRKAASR